MTKIVYNACFGGFGLSKTAVEYYNSRVGLTGEFAKTQYDIGENRADPILVELVELLGADANGSHADLRIIDLPEGTKYRITEYDGSEFVETENSVQWKVA